MKILTTIRELCAQRGESLASLERKLGFGNGTIGRWETSYPSSDRLAKVADYFGVSTDYLLERAPAPPNAGLNNAYLSLLQRAQSDGIDPDDIDLALRTIAEIRAKNKVR